MQKYTRSLLIFGRKIFKNRPASLSRTFYPSFCHIYIYIHPPFYLTSFFALIRGAFSFTSARTVCLCNFGFQRAIYPRRDLTRAKYIRRKLALSVKQLYFLQPSRNCCVNSGRNQKITCNISQCSFSKEKNCFADTVEGRKLHYSNR